MKVAIIESRAFKTKINSILVQIETIVNNEMLKGELEYWSKDYIVKLSEPFKSEFGAHLSYTVPAKYVLTKSQNPSCIEIELLEKSKEILVELYLEHKKSD
ncbi:hypothetical protein N5T96_10155 [Aliarcobacter butzleri]|uniref:hypothetical protein n=1 Tax=Aliarcobacter butzleri TaxID=28197 RepID=UPI0021B5D303|nr:hypothetical protein [Aliarcobacter butzleri]MCT7566700.1 hypothetical protein [Aliarcobacter butzleri]